MARAILESAEQSTGAILIFFHLACVSFRVALSTVERFGFATPMQGSPFPASSFYIPAEHHRLYIFQQNSIASIYFSRTASPVYTLAEQHRMFVYASCEWGPLGVATPGSGGPSPVGPRLDYLVNQNQAHCSH